MIMEASCAKVIDNVNELAIVNLIVRRANRNRR